MIKMEQKPKVDPGWNDPPMLNYNSSNPPPKSRITNKRVAFPLYNNINTPTTKSQSPSSEPLPHTTSPLLSPNMMVPQENNISDTKKNLSKFFKSDEAKVLFSTAWDEGKLSIECKKNVDLLTKFLVDNNRVGANELKMKLLNEYKDSCEKWLCDIEL